MAVPERPCRVVIVGGSIAGLSLANMLERAGIDYVVLEAHGDIAPQVGASIAIYPHFARILDQIGCWDALRGLIHETANHGFYRNQRGEAIFDFRGFADGLERRHGYPVIFIERQRLLEALYDNLKHKEKVLVNKRFVCIQTLKDGIRALMQDGSSYEGDILIGADGMHSAVRRAMHKLGKSLSPGYFDRDEYSEVPCSYKCIFGISHPTAGIKQGTNHIVLGEGHSYLILTGCGRIYWFLNVKNHQVTYGKEIPRYSAEDERRLAEEHFGDQLNECDRFEDVYRNKIVATLTPLHEYQWKRWYFQRIMTIGDASHKLHPISGNGGASAIEDAATLFNVLRRKLDQIRDRLSTEDFQDVFSETQRLQENRTRHLIDHATKMQSFDAMESAIAPLVVRFVIPHLTDDAALARVGENTTQGRRIESLPVPRRPRYVPYEDELPSKPLRGISIVRGCIILWYLAHFIYAVAPQSLVDLTCITKYSHVVIQCHRLVGIGYGDEQRYSLTSQISLFPMILIWNLEGYRRGNVRSIGSWPVPMLFCGALSMARQTAVISLYFVLAAINSSRAKYASVGGRPLPVSAVKATRVITGIVYILAVVFLGLQPFYQVVGDAIASPSFLQWSPLYIAILIRLLTVVNKSLDRHDEFGPKTYLGMYLNKDYKPLATLYRVLFVFGFLANMFVPAPASSQRVITSIIVVHCLHSAFEMRRLGYTTTREAVAAMLGILLAIKMTGPVALFAATSYWRERVIHRLSK